AEPPHGLEILRPQSRKVVARYKKDRRSPLLKHPCDGKDHMPMQIDVEDRRVIRASGHCLLGRIHCSSPRSPDPGATEKLEDLHRNERLIFHDEYVVAADEGGNRLRVLFVRFLAAFFADYAFERDG